MLARLQRAASGAVAQRSHREEGSGTVKPRELPSGHIGSQLPVDQVGDVPEAHLRHFCHGFKLQHDLPGNTV
jgi:hypothetical protein